MDEQIVDLMRDQFKLIHDKIDMTHASSNAKLDEMRVALDGHVLEDRQYWKSIDEQRAQLSVIKWLFSGGAGTGLLAWIYSKFGGH